LQGYSVVDVSFNGYSYQINSNTATTAVAFQTPVTNAGGSGAGGNAVGGAEILQQIKLL
jgi:hypothetical protein